MPSSLHVGNIDTLGCQLLAIFRQLNLFKHCVRNKHSLVALTISNSNYYLVDNITLIIREIKNKPDKHQLAPIPRTACRFYRAACNADAVL